MHLLLFNEHFRRIRRVKPEEILTIACLRKNVKYNRRDDVIAICAQGVLRRSPAAMSCQLRTPFHEKYTTHYNLASFCLSAHPLMLLFPLGVIYTIQYNTIQYNTIQYNTIQYNTIQYNTIQYNTIQYNTIQYNTIQYNTIQYNTITLFQTLQYT